jgi:hypothetical protein
VLIILGTAAVLTAVFKVCVDFGRTHLLAGIKSKSKSAKFAESVFNFVVYALLFSLGLAVFLRESWTSFPVQTKHFWIGWPNHPIDDLFRYLYCVELGFYLQQCVVLFGLSEPKKDFFEYVVHHVVTLALLASSYYFR